MAFELLTVGQMAQADALTIAGGTPGITLMHNAGRAVAQAITARWAPRQTVILCGPGNNGGDGWVVALALHALGWPVRVASMVPVDALKGDARLAADAWVAECAQHDPQQPAWQMLDMTCLDGAELVVDALFGAGLSKPLEGLPAEVLSRAHARGLSIVAVDVPSGVWGDTGEATGAVPCELTVTFFRKKPGHMLMPGRALCGKVVVADIGIQPEVLTSLDVRVWDNCPCAWRTVWPHREEAGHKYHRGHAVIWGGPIMTGAPRLSARAAARVGAGLTTVCVPQSAWPVYASTLTSIMVHPVAGEGATQWQAGLKTLLDTARLTAALIGPGAAGGTHPVGVKALVLTMLASGLPVVLDADALSVFRDDPALLFAAIAGHGRPVVMTPHEGEFARLFPASVIDPSEGKLERTRRAAQLSGAIVLLKGADTVVAAPDGRAMVNAHAPSTLATAGSGDVLAGLIVGLLAQGMPAWQATCAAVWLHGDAAHVFGPGLIADDLPEQIPQVLRRLAEQISHC